MDTEPPRAGGGWLPDTGPARVGTGCLLLLFSVIRVHSGRQYIDKMTRWETLSGYFSELNS